MNVIRRESAIKEIEPKDNMRRLLIKGQFPQGWAHCNIEIKRVGNNGFFINFYSLADGSLIKEIEVKNCQPGDSIKLNGAIVSFEITLTDGD